MSKASWTHISGLLIVTIILIVCVGGCSIPQSPAPSTNSNTSDNPAQPPAKQTEPAAKNATYGSKSAALKANWTLEEMLQYAIEDEYLARAEYRYVITTFNNQNPFANIVTAEETHINALKGLYNARNMTVPADDAGRYLVKPTTIKDSLSLGVDAEIANINMYRNFLTAPNLPDDIKTVFTQLKTGSENHLNAFQSALRRY